MEILVPVAPGELIDKITILRLKSERISDAAKLAHIRHELEMLAGVTAQSVPMTAEVSALEAELQAINAELWDIEDAIRAADARNDFGPAFIALAQAVYRTNDRRAESEEAHQLVLGSAIVEEKVLRRSWWRPMTDPIALIARAQADLAAAEAALSAKLEAERTRARGEIVRRLHEVRRMRNPSYPYASQAGQDMVVDRILGGRRNGIFVDVGGYDGVTGSNTLFLEQYRGWKGVLVEPVRPTTPAPLPCAAVHVFPWPSQTAMGQPI